MIKRFILNWIHRNACDIRAALAIPTLPKHPQHFDELVKNVERQQAMVKKKLVTAQELMRGTVIFIITAIFIYGCNTVPVKADGGKRSPSSIREWKRAGSPLPAHPISHDRDGKLIVGTADAFGN